MNFNEIMKECTKPHPLLHTVMGVGVGLLISGLFPELFASSGMLLGVVLVLGAFLGEFMFKK